ncbi:hypothetical protein ACQKKX_03445 [Neorhizobium sp. NPDC001467]|uniref:hypothetical protein n=1 Tax=Neorhizobium sp. NPDC001467 TaxID=3390595 RepID=UPI003CFF5519
MALFFARSSALAPGCRTVFFTPTKIPSQTDGPLVSHGPKPHVRDQPAVLTNPSSSCRLFPSGGLKTFTPTGHGYPLALFFAFDMGNVRAYVFKSDRADLYIVHDRYA